MTLRRPSAVIPINFLILWGFLLPFVSCNPVFAEGEDKGEDQSEEAACEKYVNGSPDWKLTRDNLPEIYILENTGETVDQVTDPEERKRLAERKLEEEFTEFKKNPTAEELGDMLDAIEAIRYHHGIDENEVEQSRAKKHAKKGAFQKSYVVKIK